MWPDSYRWIYIYTLSVIFPLTFCIYRLHICGTIELHTVCVCEMAEGLGVELTVRSVLNALQDVTDWYRLGIELDIPIRFLDEVEKYPICQQKSRFVIQWLQYDVEASWSKLVNALVTIDCRRVAMKIMQQHNIPGSCMFINTCMYVAITIGGWKEAHGMSCVYDNHIHDL